MSSPAPRVLVTRAAADAPELCAALRAAGMTPVMLPLIARELCAPGGIIWPTEAPDWIVTTSPAASAALATGVFQFPQARVAVLGSASAAAAAEVGVKAHVIGEAPQAGGTPALHRQAGGTPALRRPAGETPASQGPAAQLAAQLLGVRGGAPRRVLWLRGNRALPELRTALLAAGVAVDEVEVYTTSLLEPSATELAAALAGSCATIFASPSAVESMVAALQRSGNHALSDCGLCIAAGPTTLAALARAGFSRTIEAAGPAAADLATAAVVACRISP